MNKSIKFLLIYIISCLIIFFTGFFKLIAPDYNLLVLVFGVFFIVLQKNLTKTLRKTIFLITFFITFIFYFPFKIISFNILCVSIIFFISIYMLQYPFELYNLKISENEKRLKAKENIINRINTVSIKNLQKKDDDVEYEIKQITSLYNTLKSLSFILNINEAKDIITEILIKIMNSHFNVKPDEFNFILLFLREKEFYIAGSYGFDDEILKKNEKQIVSYILRRITKFPGEMFYIPEIKDETSINILNFIKSIVYIPFYAQKNLFGVFFLCGMRPNLFEEKHIEYLKLLSNQISMTMEKIYLYEEVDKLSKIDSLTGLYVHRFFQEKLEEEINRANRYGGSVSLVIGDVDFFKKINDTHGHLAGDYILKSIAFILKNYTTQSDTVARYGGEEFVIIMPETVKDTAHMRAVKIRKAIEAYNFIYNNIPIKVTMSMGVATYPVDAKSRRELIENADKALYRAKEEGRNRVLKF
ncbi:MAG: sensor domain-containing diguanylate cyclase [Candidatus Goldbacteria bacterium]|nr:sensor domain-containing diguanylate cyclase [Candidatus Goldiibacteriota bacterium]